LALPIRVVTPSNSSTRLDGFDFNKYLPMIMQGHDVCFHPYFHLCLVTSVVLFFESVSLSTVHKCTLKFISEKYKSPKYYIYRCLFTWRHCHVSVLLLLYDIVSVTVNLWTLEFLLYFKSSKNLHWSSWCFFLSVGDYM
jgi:hypothetical protein